MDIFGMCLVLLAMNFLQLPFSIAGVISLLSSFRIWRVRRRIDDWRTR